MNCFNAPHDSWLSFSHSLEAGTVSQLRLLDLRGDGCARISAPTDSTHARNHTAGRAFSTAVDTEHDDVENLLYVFRLAGEDVIAVFDRGTGKRESRKAGRLTDYPELPEVLERHGIGLVVQVRLRMTGYQPTNFSPNLPGHMEESCTGTCWRRPMQA